MTGPAEGEANGPVATLLPLGAFTQWLASGQRGLSSEAIVRHLTGQPVGRFASTRHPDYPHDPDDFRRCQLLLRKVPLAGLVFGQMRTASPVWARLVDAWDEIAALIQEEAPDYLDGRGSAPRAYRLMRRVIDDGVECAPCDGSGRAEQCPACKGSGRRAGGRCRADGCASGYRYCRTCRGLGYSKRGQA